MFVSYVNISCIFCDKESFVVNDVIVTFYKIGVLRNFSGQLFVNNMCNVNQAELNHLGDF